jgi:hypothetical protein
MNKTQSLAMFVWNSWKGKPATAGRFVPAKRKTPSETTTPVVARKIAKFEKTEQEAPKLKRNTVKLSEADRRELITSTQHLDACFSTMWRRAV